MERSGIAVRCSALLGFVFLFQGYDYVSLLASGIDVAMSLGDLLERIAPINDRFEFSCLSQLREETQILCALGCWPSDDFLAARHRHPWNLKHVWQPTQNQKKASSFF